MTVFQQILATPPMDYDPEKHRDIITPFELRKFTIAERARNWTTEMSRRDDNRVHDVVRYCYKYPINTFGTASQLTFCIIYAVFYTFTFEGNIPLKAWSYSIHTP